MTRAHTQKGNEMIDTSPIMIELEKQSQQTKRNLILWNGLPWLLIGLIVVLPLALTGRWIIGMIIIVPSVVITVLFSSLSLLFIQKQKRKISDWQRVDLIWKTGIENRLSAREQAIHRIENDN